MDNCIDIDPLEYTCQGQDYSIMDSESTPCEPAQLIESLINKDRVVVFSKSFCPHCQDSKTLLNDLGVEYTAVELDKLVEGSHVQNILGEMTDARTVPRIFIKGQCVGGNSDLQTLGSSGELQNLLETPETEEEEEAEEEEEEEEEEEAEFTEEEELEYLQEDEEGESEYSG